MDSAIAFSSGARVIQGLTGIGSIFFIATFLTDVEQGFYFTFGSIVSLQVFFELGLTGIMTQFVAHEAAHLKLEENNIYQGEYKYKSRLASLIHFCSKWYAILAFIISVFLGAVGFFYFTKYGSQIHSVEWKFPWFLVCLGTGVKFFEAPLTSILTGLGFVKEMNKIFFFQQLIIPVFTWIGFACGIKLYVIGIGYLLSTLIWFIIVFYNKLHPIIINLLKTKVYERVDYFKEIFPYQWKIALSWICGYFIFQFFNPIIFAIDGAEAAGQMGMTLQALNAILALSLSWMNTKIPLYCQLIAKRNYSQLDTIFNKTQKQMISVCCGLLAAFFLVIILMKKSQLSFNGNMIANRFLDYWSMLMMIIPIFLHQFTDSWATYLRCHKKEPFLIYSLVLATLTIISTIVFGNRFGLDGVTTGYCFVYIVTFPLGYWLYSSSKVKWHSSNQ